MNENGREDLELAEAHMQRHAYYCEACVDLCGILQYRSAVDGRYGNCTEIYCEAVGPQCPHGKSGSRLGPAEAIVKRIEQPKARMM